MLILSSVSPLHYQHIFCVLSFSKFWSPLCFGNSINKELYNFRCAINLIKIYVIDANMKKRLVHLWLELQESTNFVFSSEHTCIEFQILFLGSDNFDFWFHMTFRYQLEFSLVSADICDFYFEKYNFKLVFSLK